MLKYINKYLKLVKKKKLEQIWPSNKGLSSSKGLIHTNLVKTDVNFVMHTTKLRISAIFARCLYFKCEFYLFKYPTTFRIIISCI